MCGICGKPADVRMRQVVEPISEEGRRFFWEHPGDLQIVGICISCARACSDNKDLIARASAQADLIQ